MFRISKLNSHCESFHSSLEPFRYLGSDLGADIACQVKEQKEKEEKNKKEGPR